MKTTRWELSGDKKTVRLVRETWAGNRCLGFEVVTSMPIERCSASTYSAIRGQL